MAHQKILRKKKKKADKEVQLNPSPQKSCPTFISMSILWKAFWTHPSLSERTVLFHSGEDASVSHSGKMS